MVVHSFCFLLDVSGIECILEILYLYAAVLYSMDRFDVKLIVVSVVVGFRYMSVSRFSVFLIISKSRKLILVLVSCVELSCMSLCTRFMYVVMRSELVFSSVVYNTGQQNLTFFSAHELQ